MHGAHTLERTEITMGPHLICDKSSLQALSRAELNALRRYYALNIPPVLLLEILGDLKKADDRQASQKEVQILADKLAPSNISVNVEFRRLVLGELAGEGIGMGGVPVLRGGKRVLTGEGKAGIVFETTSENHALLRWQANEFHEAEAMLAADWRRTTQAIDLEAMQRQLRPDYSQHLSLRSFAEIVAFVDEMIKSGNDARLLVWFLHDADIWTVGRREKLAAVIGNGNISLKAVPYTAFCLRTALIFHFALVFGLITTRATNRVDLEYMYYAPFCWAFSSGDILHRDLAPYVLPKGVEFVSRDELKRDLKELAAWWSGMTRDEMAQEKRRVGPPENEDSVTHRLWKKHMMPGYRQRERLQDKLMPERVKEMVRHVQKLTEAGQGSEQDAHSLDLQDCEFVVVKKTVSLDGPCICGSNATFAECCGQEIAKERGYSPVSRGGQEGR
jgi:hypothetical protein